ncbi:hypothetical protein MHJ97_00695 [Macrococcus epidermidis]|uniref:hypothetical protein n=1 Tax=Macrococcus epidermidis TaxID=1902580 RepID=UPI001EF38D80|nr:hypothetical protein [Macrococcus epidermidis]MCG7418949.1 hypothetical protein [Macrococcus epidermidis]
MKKIHTSTGFILAGLYNLFGILIFSKFFMNPLLAQYDPIVFSWVGQVSIILWGFAYIAISKNYKHVPYLVLLFAIEKALYVYVWADWLIGDSNKLHEIPDTLTKIFFTIYGIGDMISGIFFAAVAYRLL